MLLHLTHRSCSFSLLTGTTDFPLTAGAFANCAALSQQLGHAFAVLAAQQAGVSEVEAQLAELRRQGAASKQAMALAQVRVCSCACRGLCGLLDDSVMHLMRNAFMLCTCTHLRSLSHSHFSPFSCAQKDEAHTSNLFESNLGMLVSGFPDMSANLENLRNTLPSLTQLLCKDVGEWHRQQDTQTRIQQL